MAAPRHLANAPITEAVFNFRVRARRSFDAESLRGLADALSSEFPETEEHRQVRAQFNLTPGQEGPLRVESEALQGFSLKSGDARSIVQLKVDGFSFHRLKPYTSWDELFPRVLRFWSEYRQFAEPEELTRLAVRFINHVRFPAGVTDLGEYLIAEPRVPEGVPDQVSGFFSQITVYHPGWDIEAVVRQVLETDLSDRVPTILLDIDAFKHVSLDPSSEGVSEIFDSLRSYKNQLFFGSLTERTLELFG